MLSTIEINWFEIKAQTSVSRRPYLLALILCHCNHIKFFYSIWKSSLADVRDASAPSPIFTFSCSFRPKLCYIQYLVSAPTGNPGSATGLYHCLVKKWMYCIYHTNRTQSCFMKRLQKITGYFRPYFLLFSLQRNKEPIVSLDWPRPHDWLVIIYEKWHISALNDLNSDRGMMGFPFYALPWQLVS